MNWLLLIVVVAAITTIFYYCGWMVNPEFQMATDAAAIGDYSKAIYHEIRGGILLAGLWFVVWCMSSDWRKIV